MFGVIFLSVLALIWIVFAVIQDLKTREIANWLNFSLIIFALGFRFFYSLFFREGNFAFFLQGVIGFGIFLVLGNLLYYCRIFAGGDAKLMMALGSIIPLSESFLMNAKICAFFLIAFLAAGAIYGLSASFFLGFRNFTAFNREFKKNLKKSRKIILAVMGGGLLIMLFGFFEVILFPIGVLMFLFPCLYVYAKSIDNACMVKKISAGNLREGDWLYKDLKLGNRIIKAKWDGLSKEEINAIRKKHRYAVIRQGIAFSPVFLAGFLAVLFIYLIKPELFDIFLSLF